MSAVSVVMAAWNAERFIAEAIGTVLEQTQPAAELIVVDDGSTDGTATLADDLGARVLRCEHRGIGPSRNEGIAASSGEAVAFLDADDLWVPHKLEAQVAVLDAAPAVEAVASLVDEFLDERDGPPVGVREPRRGASATLASNTVVRRSAIDRVGPFDADMPVADWLRWWAKARRAGVVEHIVPEVLVHRRIHGANNSAREPDGGARFLDVLREHRRAQRGAR